MRECIAPENLPKDYGGEFEWSFFDPPKLDEQTRAVIGEMPRGPWIFKNGKIVRPSEYEGHDKIHEPQTKVQERTQGIPTDVQVNGKIPDENGVKPNFVTVG